MNLCWDSFIQPLSKVCCEPSNCLAFIPDTVIGSTLDLLGQSFLNWLAVEPRNGLEYSSWLLLKTTSSNNLGSAWSSLPENPSFIRSAGSYSSTKEACDNPWSLGSDPKQEDWRQSNFVLLLQYKSRVLFYIEVLQNGDYNNLWALQIAWSVLWESIFLM
jgi:hypothetical protein